MNNYPDGSGWNNPEEGRWQPTQSVPLQGGPNPPQPPRLPPTPSPRSTAPAWLWAVVGGLALLLVVAAGSLVAVTLLKSDKAAPSPTTVTPSTSTTVETTIPVVETTVPSLPTEPEIVVDTTVPTPPAIGDVRSEPAGLFCRDLKAKGYSYSAAVDYWRLNGQTNSMDADKNGIPCETVYPRSDITSYWPSTAYQSLPSYGLPSGLLCKDLFARGMDVYEALTYFIWEGHPSRMDADGNGIPCETVYPNARQIWLYEF